MSEPEDDGSTPPRASEVERPSLLDILARASAASAACLTVVLTAHQEYPPAWWGVIGWAGEVLVGIMLIIYLVDYFSR
jgi:hypothetical protein